MYFWVKFKKWFWDDADWSPIIPYVVFLILYGIIVIIIGLKFWNALLYKIVGQHINSMILSNIIKYHLLVSVSTTLISALIYLGLLLFKDRKKLNQKYYQKIFLYLFGYTLISNLLLVFLMQISLHPFLK